MTSDDTRKIFTMMLNFRKYVSRAVKFKELSHAEYMMMGRMYAGSANKATVSALSASLKVSKPAVSQMLNNLESKGYVERITEKTDRRVVCIQLTEEGKQVCTEAIEALQAVIDNIFSRMEKQDELEFMRLVDLFNNLLVQVQQEASNNTQHES